MSAVDQFRSAPIKTVVPLSDDLRDAHFVPVERYPAEFAAFRKDDEVGALCVKNLNEIHGVYVRLLCPAIAIKVDKFVDRKGIVNEEPEPYVAAHVPNTYFLDTRAQ